MSDIRAWLDELDLGQYADMFEENDIDRRALLQLSDQDLKDIGVTSLGHRRVFLGAINELAAAKQSPLPKNAPEPTREAERRQITVMFCDLVGSTALSERLDPEDLRDVMRAYQDATGTAITRFGGHIAQTLGDGLMVYFGYPTAHEEDAQRAVAAGLNILSAMTSLNDEMASKIDVTLAVRVGIHTGMVVAGEVGEYDTRGELAVVGDTPNIAARVEALAERNTVVVSERTHRLVEPLFTFEPLGEQMLRGVEAPVALYRVSGARAAESRFEAMHPKGLTPLVGRDEEIGLLKGRWAQARDGEGQVILLCGEPGIGKSRITGTFRDLVASDDHTRIQYQCSPFFNNTAFHPIIQQAEFAAGIAAGDDAEIKLDKLEALLAQATDNVAETAPLLAAIMSLPTDRYPVLDLSPQRQKDLTIEAIVAQISGLAAARPVVVVFEDVHWIDPTSLEALDHLVAATATLPLLVIVTFRPEFDARWGSMSHVSFYTLTRLGRRQCGEMIARVAGDKPLPDVLVDQIIAKTDGVPLFIEELAKAVIESEIVADAGDHYALSGSVDEIAIPDTLHDSLMARLDKLIPVKNVAQIGAAIGREFSYRLVAALTPKSETDLDTALETLVNSELVHRRGTPPDAIYIFKHALVQDAAYDSMLKRDRQVLHSEIVNALIANVPGIELSEPETIAHHYARAGLMDLAAPHWLAAGNMALQQSANNEAITYFTAGLEAVGAMPADQARTKLELGLQTSLGTALVLAKGYAVADVEEAYTRALAIAGESQSAADLFAPLFGLCVVFWVRGDMGRSETFGRRLLGVADTADDAALKLIASGLYGMGPMLFSGRYTEARRHLEDAIAIDDSGDFSELKNIIGLDPGTFAVGYFGVTLWRLGYPDQARAMMERAMAMGDSRAHPMTKAYTRTMCAGVLVECGEFDRAVQVLRQGIEYAREQGSHDWVGVGLAFLGGARLRLGDIEQGMADLAEGQSIRHEVGDMLRWWDSYWVEAHTLDGDPVRAIEVADRSLELMRVNDDCLPEPELLREKGKALAGMGQDHSVAAELCFQESLAAARRQNAKGSELRGAISLARFWRTRNKCREALELLSPVYDWFTEGFDTADLKEAKALLDELK